MRVYKALGLVLSFMIISEIKAATAPARAAKSPQDKKAVAPLVKTESIEELTARLRPSVVIVRQIGRDGNVDGVGSGFVISSEGLIATSLHVIGEARAVKVEFSDGRKFDVIRVHAWDRKTDLAVIAVEATGLSPLRLGDSDLIKQGTSVIAMGNPHGLTHSVVEGVVSAMRQFEDLNLIQLAIPIEPGNSGGPLVDRQGRVQGVLSLKSAITENLGFAMPVNMLKPLLDHPNSVPMSRWITWGSLDPRQWTPMLGSRWTRRAGQINVEGLGSGFGGRSFCLARQDPLGQTYELSVRVKLDNEAGAAGLIFAADGGQKHYGFYPTAGQMRLTRFEGPDINSWTILLQTNAPAYRPGEWNTLNVRVEPQRILCSVNGMQVFESKDSQLRGGQVGLAKFRQTKAAFADFSLGATIPTGSEAVKETESDRLNAQAKRLDNEAAQLRLQATKVHAHEVQIAIKNLLGKPEEAIDLFEAALQLARLDNPELNLPAYRAELKSMVAEARSLFSSNADEEVRLGALIAFLFQQNGYHGSRSDYYKKSNSYISDVIDYREGIPITLSVLFLELGRQLGVTQLYGLPLPGHFMVGYQPKGDALRIIDVFDSGKILTRSEAIRISGEESDSAILDQHFLPATKQEILVRMIRNLTSAVASEQKQGQLLRYLDLILTISPDEPMERYRRAVARFQERDLSGAEEDLRWILNKKPRGVNLERVEELLRSL